MSDRFPILVVEDDATARCFLEKILKCAGYRVISADNGISAYAVLRQEFCPIVLTDWMMPEMDGLELCREIRNHNWPSYVFIIFMTARNSEEDIVNGLESGADDYLTKPLNASELIARLKTAERILNLEKSLVTEKEKIRMLSTIDPLTGVYNRAYLADRLNQEIRAARRYQRPFSLIMLDLDDFKAVNDTFGHQIGDWVLQECAVRIKQLIRRQVDWVVRYGGEEFLIVLPETYIEGAQIMAQRLCAAISQIELQLQSKPLGVTASFGVTGFAPETPDEETDPESIIKQADNYLYAAKRHGKNRVISGPLS